LRLVQYREIPEDQCLRDQWNALVEEMERPEVFHTYEWALAVSRAYCASIEPVLFLGYDGDTLAGVVALATDKSKQSAFFLSGTTADYCDFVCRSERRTEFVSAVFAELHNGSLPVVVLANLPADSATSLALNSATRKHGYFIFSRPGYECAQIEFATYQQRELVKQSMGRKQMLRRNLKAMGKLSPVALRHSRSWGDLAGVLPVFFKAHVARFLATGRISNLTRPERRMFLSELARLLSQRGWLTHSCLMIGDQPVAWNYGFQFAGSWFWYQPTFDTNLQQYSPGFCLLSKIVEEACDTPKINFVDLGLGEEDYKGRLATGGRKTLHVTAATSRAVRAKVAIRYRLAAALKKAPRLERMTRSAINWISVLRKHLQNHGFLDLLRWLWSRCRQALFGQREVLFFQFAKTGSLGSVRSPDSVTLQPLDLDLLAVAALNYSDDQETLGYLVRAAERLGATGTRGFGFVTSEGIPVHFCWVADFEGFYMSELSHRLGAPSPDSVLLFDCWTPGSMRGRGYYGRAISRVADRLETLGKAPWIFSAATNVSSVRGVEKSGFEQRFSLIRKRTMFLSRVVQSRSFVSATPPMDASSAA
jgi:CelD/BcsL family acetyltransferase involved in cellulose biosynthesis